MVDLKESPEMRQGEAAIPMFQRAAELLADDANEPVCSTTDGQRKKEFSELPGGLRVESNALSRPDHEVM